MQHLGSRLRPAVVAVVPGGAQDVGEAGRGDALARAAVDRRARVAACAPGRVRRGKPGAARCTGTPLPQCFCCHENLLRAAHALGLSDRASRSVRLGWRAILNKLAELAGTHLLVNAHAEALCLCCECGDRRATCATARHAGVPWMEHPTGLVLLWRVCTQHAKTSGVAVARPDGACRPGWRRCGAPGWSIPTRLVLVAALRQRNGVFFGTPGGALPPLTPIDMARTPAPASTGTALRVRPGTSLCGPRSKVTAPAQLSPCAYRSAAVTRWRRQPRLSPHLADRQLWCQAKACVQVVRELNGRREQRCVRGLSLQVEWQSVPESTVLYLSRMQAQAST